MASEMLYYTLEQEFDRISTFVLAEMPEIVPASPWFSGARFAVHPPSPIQFVLDPESGPVLPDFFDAGIPLFSSRLCRALRDAGAGNFDAYPAMLRDTVQERDIAGYFAVNIVGLVACADMAGSEYLDPTGTGEVSVFFSDLKIDDDKAKGLRLFRLAESVGELVLSRSVVDALRPLSLVGLRFLPAS